MPGPEAGGMRNEVAHGHGADLHCVRIRGRGGRFTVCAGKLKNPGADRGNAGRTCRFRDTPYSPEPGANPDGWFVPAAISTAVLAGAAPGGLHGPGPARLKPVNRIVLSMGQAQLPFFRLYNPE